MAKSSLSSSSSSSCSESRIIQAHKCKRPCLNSLCQPRLLIYIPATLFILYQSLGPTNSWDFTNQWPETIATTKTTATLPIQDYSCSQELKTMVSKLQESVTFLPLKDLRYSNKALEGHTWFMSSTHDTHEKSQVQYQEFPSKGRVLCLKGKDTHDGSWNSYALAWPQALPPNATLMKGLTFVSYNHYNYDNIWHGLSAVVPFVAWHLKNKCSAPPLRWVLYHWGELRIKMGPWISSLMEATFGEPLNIEKFDTGDGNESTDNYPACFERAVVMRHNEGGMSRDKRLQVYDFLRCKARSFCNVSSEDGESQVYEDGFPVIGMTMFMRTESRSFKNESSVIRIFSKACRKVSGCRLTVAYANNLTFCEQVRLMSLTDILVSPHGAQLTNMFLMDRNSSVMEFFPKGWLKLAGVGQYVYHWIASWSGMNHRGAWRDPVGGDSCPFAEDDRRCMSIYKNARIGHNESYFSEWARNVLSDVRLGKAQIISNKTRNPDSFSSSCGC
ncbi:hypothetical protein OROMI_033318 [Orobanche minor]